MQHLKTHWGRTNAWWASQVQWTTNAGLCSLGTAHQRKCKYHGHRMTALQWHMHSDGHCSVAVNLMTVKLCARSDFGSAKHTTLKLDGYADVLQILLTDGAEIKGLCSTA